MFSVVKMMKEQGNQFDWSQIAIDIPSLPCFDQSKIAKFLADRNEEPTPVDSLLEEGYATIKVTVNPRTGAALWFVVKVTGETPSATYTPNPEHDLTEAEDFAFVDCEPVRISELELADVLTTELIPARTMRGLLNRSTPTIDYSSIGEHIGEHISTLTIDYSSIREHFASYDSFVVFPLLVIGIDTGGE